MKIRPSWLRPLSASPLPRRLYWRARPSGKPASAMPVRRPQRAPGVGASSASHRKLDIYV
jgi:hypothetical protein